MPWGAVAAAVVGAYSASQSNKAANKGAKGSEAAAQASIDEQRREYDQSRADQLPWLTAGSGALGQMNALNAGDFSSFHASPDYQFALKQGMDSLDSSAAARGGLFGGGHTRDLVNYGQGMAEQNYNNYYNRLQSMAGQGQTTASGLGALGANMATNIGNQYTNAATARNSAYGTIANNNSQAAAGFAGALNNAYQGYRAQQYTPTSGYGPYSSGYNYPSSSTSGYGDGYITPGGWSNAYGAG